MKNEKMYKMQLGRKYRKVLIRMSNDLDIILQTELERSGRKKEEYRDDDMFNAILSAVGSIEEALEQEDC
jgi:hypothetical protein